MKKILIVITNFRHGGTNKSLENLLSVIDKDKYQIDVFGMEHYGPYQKMLKNCTIIPKNILINGLISHLNDNKGFDKLLSFGIKLINKIANRFNFDFTQLIFNKVISRLVKSGNYNTVISYSEGVPTKFLCNVKHNNKIAWVHCDYSNYMLINNKPNENRIYNKFNSVVCVSKYTKGEFLKHININPEKVHYIHNILNSDEILEKSNLKINDSRFINDKFTIISVGRIDIVKNFKIIPKIVSELKKEQCNFRWYLIGPPGVRSVQEEFENNIKLYNVENNFFWLNSKNNPYKYIVNSDLLVMTSKSEACPYVLNEARILNIPVLTTNYGSAYEFINNYVDGIIVSEERLKDEIKLLISNKSKYKDIRNNEYEYNYETILSQIYQLI